MQKGQVAVVTGGSRGIGRAIALKMAENGADVAVVYAGNEQAAQEACSLAGQFGVKCRAYRCDVSSFDETRELVDEILKEFGKIDILVNNAGITRDGSVATMKEQDFDDVISINLKGSYHMIRHCCRHFLHKRSGRIINISSVAGLAGNVGQANYASSKAGLIGLTKTVARELAGRGVTCNAIAPGFIDTDMTQQMNERAREAVLSGIPMNRAGRPEEVAALAVFLAGEDAAYITGEVIRVDGGLCI
ncbi:MAG TPA: 3-oxoacyl-[acyl-carrier-protein] reductase [Caproiciproducens sp.]|nr:3-oxoacyl-[acyl-carrier-protein] reductase [Caproiciproducens sp.]